MKLGFFAANYAHLSLEEVAKIMVQHGYEMMEIPAYSGCEQFNCDEILKPGKRGRTQEDARIATA